MAIPKIVAPINDFSAGEVDVQVKRSDLGLVKVGARQMSNWRILNSHKMVNRPGRAALFPTGASVSTRVEEINVAGTAFYLGFGAAALAVFSVSLPVTAVFFTSHKGDGVTTLPWTTPTLGNIVFAIIGKSIYLTYGDDVPNNVPQVLSWDGVSTWTLSTYAETTTAGGQKRTAFYRIAPQGITLLPSATSGNVNITFSANVLSGGMIGTRIRFCQRQLQILSVSSGTQGTATVVETLPPAQNLTLTNTVGIFNIGDVVLGSITGAQGIVAAAPQSQVIFVSSPTGFINVGDSLHGGTSGATGVVTSIAGFPNITVSLSTGTVFSTGETVTDTTNGHTFTASSVSLTSTLLVQLIPTSTGSVPSFTTSDTIVGPSGSSTISAIATTTPQAVTVWDQEVMNAFQGYPLSVFTDQARLGFCNLPALRSALIWSAVNLPNDLYTGAQPDDSIFELAPDQSQIFFVVVGMESSEFVFTDRAIYYLPINAANPLKPGSVAFNKLSDYGCLPHVQPRRAEQTIIYMKAGGAAVGAVQAPGAYYRPYVVENISEMHSHLFTASLVTSIAIPSGPVQFEELYIYMTLANGTLVIGHYGMRNGLLEPGPEGKPSVGWVPWAGAGNTSWVSALQGDVIFTTTYGTVNIVEKLDNTQYLDGALFVNALPVPFQPPGGKGPCWVFPGPNLTVFLIDQGTQFMGTYNIDANGFIIPQHTGGENISSAQLIMGQPWTAVFEPHTPQVPGGPSQQQRMRRRKIAKALATVQNSSGFVLAKLVENQNLVIRRIPYWFVGEDATQPAPLREDSYQIRPHGREYDPRSGIIKDTPGPLTVVEYGLEVTV